MNSDETIFFIRVTFSSLHADRSSEIVDVVVAVVVEDVWNRSLSVREEPQRDEESERVRDIRKLKKMVERVSRTIPIMIGGDNTRPKDLYQSHFFFFYWIFPNA